MWKSANQRSNAAPTSCVDGATWSFSSRRSMSPASVGKSLNAQKHNSAEAVEFGRKRRAASIVTFATADSHGELEVASAASADSPRREDARCSLVALQEEEISTDGEDVGMSRLGKGAILSVETELLASSSSNSMEVPLVPLEAFRADATTTSPEERDARPLGTRVVSLQEVKGGEGTANVPRLPFDIDIDRISASLLHPLEPRKERRIGSVPTTTRRSFRQPLYADPTIGSSRSYEESSSTNTTSEKELSVSALVGHEQQKIDQHCRHLNRLAIDVDLFPEGQTSVVPALRASAAAFVAGGRDAELHSIAERVEGATRRKRSVKLSTRLASRPLLRLLSNVNVHLKGVANLLNRQRLRLLTVAARQYARSRRREPGANNHPTLSSLTNTTAFFDTLVQSTSLLTLMQEDLRRMRRVLAAVVLLLYECHGHGIGGLLSQLHPFTAFVVGKELLIQIGIALESLNVKQRAPRMEDGTAEILAHLPIATLVAAALIMQCVAGCYETETKSSGNRLDEGTSFCLSALRTEGSSGGESGRSRHTGERRTKGKSSNNGGDGGNFSFSRRSKKVSLEHAASALDPPLMWTPHPAPFYFGDAWNFLGTLLQRVNGGSLSETAKSDPAIQRLEVPRVIRERLPWLPRHWMEIPAYRCFEMAVQLNRGNHPYAWQHLARCLSQRHGRLTRSPASALLTPVSIHLRGREITAARALAEAIRCNGGYERCEKRELWNDLAAELDIPSFSGTAQEGEVDTTFVWVDQVSCHDWKSSQLVTVNKKTALGRSLEADRTQWRVWLELAALLRHEPRTRYLSQNDVRVALPDSEERRVAEDGNDSSSTSSDAALDDASIDPRQLPLKMEVDVETYALSLDVGAEAEPREGTALVTRFQCLSEALTLGGSVVAEGWLALARTLEDHVMCHAACSHFAEVETMVHEFPWKGKRLCREDALRQALEVNSRHAPVWLFVTETLWTRRSFAKAKGLESMPVEMAVPAACIPLWLCRYGKLSDYFPHDDVSVTAEMAMHQALHLDPVMADAVRRIRELCENESWDA